MWKFLLLTNKQFEEYKEKINYHNSKNIKVLALVISFVLGILYCFSFLNENTKAAASSYLICTAICILIFIISGKVHSNKLALGFSYILITVIFLFLLYLSIIISPQHRASALIGGLCLFPIIFIDKPWRTLFIAFLIVVIHSILSFSIKGVSLGYDDLINCIAFAIGGVLFGSFVNINRLRTFEIEKTVLLQRDIDFLTNLRNRRKMYELFAQIENNEKSCPSFAIMIDIDNFKQYNDSYGHKAGDDFLKYFGQSMLKIEKQYDITFYRYGGEEFSAFAWNIDEIGMKNLAESIREIIKNLPIENGRTISIGYVNFKSIETNNPETALSFADQALYIAKNTGRDKAVCYIKHE